MTRKNDRARQQRADESGRQVYIPHSSWTRPDRDPTAAPVIAPDDFWKKLGL